MAATTTEPTPLQRALPKALAKVNLPDYVAASLQRHLDFVVGTRPFNQSAWDCLVVHAKEIEML